MISTQVPQLFRRPDPVDLQVSRHQAIHRLCRLQFPRKSHRLVPCSAEIKFAVQSSATFLNVLTVSSSDRSSSFLSHFFPFFLFFWNFLLRFLFFFFLFCFFEFPTSLSFLLLFSIFFIIIFLEFPISLSFLLLSDLFFLMTYF